MNSTLIEKTFTLGGDLTVNRLGYGAMRITGKGIMGPPENKQEALKVLKHAVESGVNFIDTADSYGPDVSEELIAEALYPYPSGLVIGTKGGLLRPAPNEWTVDASPAHLQEVLDGSLRKLKLERIDLYQLHRIDPKIPAGETFDFLKRAQQDGKIKHIGLSEVSVDEIKEAQKFFQVVSVQNKYSFDNRTWENVLEYCTANQIAFIPWNPMNAGKIVGNKVLETIAASHKVSVHQLALAWLLNHAPNILLIPGTSSLKHLDENLAVAEIALTADEMDQIEKSI